MSEIQTVSAIVHEMAHAMLHNPEYDSDIPSRVDQARNVEEIQAESVSFTVCSYYGIQTEENSFGYISCHYCNPVGFKEVPDFFDLEKEREAPQTENLEKAEAIKPKELPVPQESKVHQSAGKSKKPSVIEKLHRFQAEDRARELKAKTMEDYTL